MERKAYPPLFFYYSLYGFSILDTIKSEHFWIDFICQTIVFPNNIFYNIGKIFIRKKQTHVNCSDANSHLIIYPYPHHSLLAIAYVLYNQEAICQSHSRKQLYDWRATSEQVRVQQCNQESSLGSS